MLARRVAEEVSGHGQRHHEEHNHRQGASGRSGSPAAARGQRLFLLLQLPLEIFDLDAQLFFAGIELVHSAPSPSIISSRK